MKANIRWVNITLRCLFVQDHKRCRNSKPHKPIQKAQGDYPTSNQNIEGNKSLIVIQNSFEWFYWCTLQLIHYRIIPYILPLRLNQWNVGDWKRLTASDNGQIWLFHKSITFHSTISIVCGQCWTVLLFKATWCKNWYLLLGLSIQCSRYPFIIFSFFADVTKSYLSCIVHQCYTTQHHEFCVSIGSDGDATLLIQFFKLPYH